MAGLHADIELPRHLDRLTDPATDLCRVRQIVSLDSGALLVALGGAAKGPLWVLGPRAERLRPVGDFDEVAAIWPAGSSAVVVQSEGALWRVDGKGRSGRLIDLPEGLGSLDVAWTDGGLLAAALVDRRPARDPEAPRLLPEPRGTVVLCRYTPTAGWTDLLEVPAGCTGLTMSFDGRRMVWIEPLNPAPEEARRAVFCAYDVVKGEIWRLAEGAGRAVHAIVAPDGSGVVYQANHEAGRPITTHCDLWWIPWGTDQRRKLTGGGRCIVDFGWGPGSDRVWFSAVDGQKMKTETLGLDGDDLGPVDVATSGVAWLPDGAAAFEAEHLERYPTLVAGGREVELPHPERYEDFRVIPVGWTAPDGLQIEGVVCEAEGTPSDAPILVRIHGGPASPVEALRSQAVRYRHLLRAGYRVFVPAFRGSLGYGDAFAQANIGSQGRTDLDDVLSGIDHLAASGLGDAERSGIFGGSYGGYLTLRALAMTDRFRAGVAMYGFVDNRWMTLETGDFTYETEYVAPLSWPPTEGSRGADVFPHLGEIDAPLLLMHGDRDVICPVSHSVVTYRALERRGVRTSLVIYPGMGHGLRIPRFQHDSARRLLAWFLEYLPPG